MTPKEQQEYDKKLINKEVKKFMKRLKDLNPQLKSVMVTDINLKIEEKVKIFKTEEKKIITDNRSFADKIMGL